MQTYICLFTEVKQLNKDLNLYKKGLVTYEEVKQRLTNISVLIDHLLSI